ncbi:MAG: hypothetical protein ISS33_04945 [Candidatus Omnitrophica bacterium]|nr:hypothetical protein [Candidatus Omnitrophota bacterium]
MDISSTSLSMILANIEDAWRAGRDRRSARIVAVVSGSESDKKAWQETLDVCAPVLFNKDGSTLVLSLQEKTGKKTTEGNFLGTLLAYRFIKRASNEKGVNYRNFVTMIGMLFGRGERISPITQAKGCRKPAIEVTPLRVDPSGGKKAFTAIEEALLYFAPVARYLENGGFRGVLNKWGDETEIASRDLTQKPEENEFSEYDVIKFIKTSEITSERARQKDWVVFNGANDMVAQLSRNEKSVLIKRLKGLGIKPACDGKYCAGVSLGPTAVSYETLDIASEVFAEEIEKDGVHFDFDPYFLMALAMSEEDRSVWEKRAAEDKGLRELVSMVPDFFEKVQEIKKRFKKIHGRRLRRKVFDLGEDSYWVDIGQHKAMREKFLSLKDDSAKGIIGRKIAKIPETRDKNGNIILNSTIAPEVKVSGSTIVGSKITGAGVVENSVIIDSEIASPRIFEAFAVRSVRRGGTELKKNSGLYESFGREPLVLEEGMRYVSVLTASGKTDMMVSEDTNLRDKENTYDVPIFGNEISFKEAYDKMVGTSIEEIEKRRTKLWKS